jgi:predicted PurR-regulated permease PerM
MPPWIPRLLVMVAGTVVGLWAAVNVLTRLRGLLVLVAIAVFLSIALEPGVNYLAGKGWRRGLATAVMVLGLLLMAAVFIGAMVPLIVNQTIKFIDRIPSYVEQVALFADRFGVEFTGDRFAEAIGNLGGDLQGLAADVSGTIFGVGTALLTTVFQLLTIGLFTFYMTAEGPKLRRTLLSVLPPDRQREVLRVFDIAIEKTGGYFYSRALLALFAAAVGWAAFTIIGVPFALALALWMGVLSQFVPVVGTYIGGALPLLIALLESPPRALAVLIFVVAYQQVENYLLAPKITHRTMSLHPALAFGSAIAGATLLGSPGALMALPLAATVQAFVSTYLHRHEVVESPLTGGKTPSTPSRPEDETADAGAPATGEPGEGDQK